MDRLTPEQVQAIAAQVYVEMLEAVYSSVGEFHFVHMPVEALAQIDAANTDPILSITTEAA